MHGATDLGAETERHAAVGGRDQSAFDKFGITETQQQFACAVGGKMFLGDRHGVAEKAVAQFLTRRLGEVGHGIRINGPAFGDPAFDLFCAVGFDGVVFRKRSKFVCGSHDEIRQFFSCHNSVSCLSSPFQRFRRWCLYSRLRRFLQARSGTIGTSGAST